MSLDAEAGWDWALVEAHEEGTESWTTLHDANGNTTRDTGESCPYGWKSLHPWVERYQTEERGPDGAISGCRATGSSGEWHAATGNSRGWREWSIDLGAYAGKRVEVSISYVSDEGVQELGAFLDDVRVRMDEREEVAGWEDGLGPWRVAGPPPGSPTTERDWRRIGAAWEEGAGITTSDTILLGMGLEDVAGAEARAAVMGRALAHLLRP